ncbi:MAG TPA: 8-amino-7-oxononanoate synthase [Burkholderiales bacterium]|nr:8-amino-7-oxononanoate synthase [Burkholderiales bacterium]
MSVAFLTAKLAAFEAEGLRRRRRVLETPQRACVTVDGRDYIAFCSNDYLGLAAHAELTAAACEGAQRFGVGAGASHLILGHTQPHHELEHALARFVGLPAALLFSSGYMANLGLIGALAARGDAIFADRLNHASLVDAALLSRAELKRYRHADLRRLEHLLETTGAGAKVIVSDAVFSMDGDIAPVRELLDLAQRFDAWLVLDDAHGFGVLGANGRGILEHAGIAAPRIAYMATLGKAAGVYGAFVAGEAELIETLVQKARTYIYTTATPPLLAHALAKSLELMERDAWRRAHLDKLIFAFKAGVRLTSWRLLPSITAIQPLVVGGSAEAVALTDQLAARGLLVPAIRPPTVPRGTARLRISLSADHTFEHVERLTAELRSLQEMR